MAETLYAEMEGPKGKAQVYEVTQESGWFLWNGMPSRTSTSDMLYEVRFGDLRESFWQEGEAATVAWELVGMPYGGDTGPRPAGPRRNWKFAL